MADEQKEKKTPKEEVLWSTLKWRVVDRTIDSKEIRIDVEAHTDTGWQKRMHGSIDGVKALQMTIQHWHNRARAAEIALKRFETRGESDPVPEEVKKREHGGSEEVPS